MRQTWVLTFLVVIILVTRTAAAGQAQQAEATERKAEALEQTAVEGSTAPPSPPARGSVCRQAGNCGKCPASPQTERPRSRPLPPGSGYFISSYFI